MLPISAAFAVLACGLEALAGYLLFGTASPGLWPWAALLHLVSATVAAVAAHGLSPPGYRQPRAWALLFYFCFVLFIPGLGLPGLFCALLPGLWFRRETKEVDWEARDLPDLPFQEVKFNPDNIFMRGGLTTVLLRYPESRWRLRAIMATRHLNTRTAVPILRLALGDAADEVRLLAYAMLDSKERALDANIEKLRHRLESAGTGTDALDWCHEQIATFYHEQAYLGLVEGEVRQYILEQAHAQITIALATKRSAERVFLLGRIALEQDRLEEADKAFVEAEKRGMTPSQVAAYRAEVAFKQGRYTAISKQLNALTARSRGVPVLARLAAYWA